ncbi:RDD family protein [Calidifontibacillus erzurumensis]|uniref:RDD family protein n=1 Tax=Calidifontibacillus erzurumensis TaxID=2741433 RepID=A0A8J8KCL6_9BACI|nr:RDD family protein [Calidifontibacillus erzurumensis]NSL52747.1 RDD family protein [Calidifontibacillus erzurumensis]
MEKRYAGFWIRVGAWFLDFLILLIPSIIIDYLSFQIAKPMDMGYWAYQFNLNTPTWTSYDTLSTLLSTIFCAIYFGWMTSKYQGTLGKLIVGLRIIGEDGRAITFARAIGRYFSYILSSFFMIGFIMVGLTKKKQGLHDKICKTYVIYKQQDS